MKLLAIALLIPSIALADSLVIETQDLTVTYVGTITAYNEDETISYVVIDSTNATVAPNERIFRNGFEDQSVNWIWDADTDNGQTGYTGHCVGTKESENGGTRVTLRCETTDEQIP